MAKRRAKGTGYLIVNADGTKTLRMTVMDPVTGKEKRLQVTAKTETACNKLMRERVREYEGIKTLVCANPAMTLVELCTNHLKSQFEQDLIKRTSRDRNEVTIKNQIEVYPIGHLQVGTITSRDLDNHFSMLISEGKLSISTIEKVKYIIDGSFKWAVRRKELSYNPMDDIRDELTNRFSKLTSKSADDEDVRIMTSEDKEKALLAAMETWKNKSYKYPGGIHMRFLVNTGMRVGEYIALRWEDYDFENHILRINKCSHMVKSDSEDSEISYVAMEGTTKNSKARNIELMPEAIEIIEEMYRLTKWKAPTDYIVLNRQGNNYTATSMEHIVGTVYKKAGIEDHVSGLHILRRTFATQLFDEGFTEKEIAAYLGDEVATVSRYYIAARKTKEIAGKRIAVVSLNRK